MDDKLFNSSIHNGQNNPDSPTDAAQTQSEHDTNATPIPADSLHGEQAQYKQGASQENYTQPGASPENCTQPGASPENCTQPGASPENCTQPGASPENCTQPENPDYFVREDENPFYAGFNPQNPPTGYSSYNQVPLHSSSFPNPPYEYSQPLSDTAPKQKKHREHKKGSGKVGRRIAAVVAAAALCVGGGYAGAEIALNGNPKVIVQRVSSSSTGTQSLSSSAVATEDIAAKIVPSVVAITTEQMTTNSFWFGNQVSSGAGSGVIMSADGYILTNNHVVSGADTIKVETADGKSYTAELVGSYANGDIAVIKIDAQNLTPVTFADSDTVKQGMAVFAVGNPEGNFSGSITSGIISATNRTISVSDSSSGSQNPGNNPYGSMFGYSYAQKTVELTVFQFDAAVSPGNSGGGLFNTNGELIGIVCAKSSDSDAEGLGFAIVSNNAFEIASALISDGSYTAPADEDGANADISKNKAILGVTVTELDSQSAAEYGFSAAGVYITGVSTQSAANAGLASGDRIISVDSTAVGTTEDLSTYLSGKEPGDTVTLQVARGSLIISCEVTLQENS